MDYSLNEDQAALVAAVQSMVRDHAELPQSARLQYQFFDDELQRKLTQGGFLDAGRELGPLEAALVVIESARIPAVVETGASALVVPQLMADSLQGPVALVSGAGLDKAHRNLSVAKSAIIDMGDDVVVMPVASENVEPVETILGYPFGRFVRKPEFSRARRLGGNAVSTLRQWWRVALAAEFAGAAQSAVAFTVDYVKQREVFGRPIGSFQAVKHRLAQCQQVANGIYYLALRAAWSASAQDADLASCYAQQHVKKLMFDLHQFNGAMGVTTEHTLHYWTYRIRALQSEVGGANGAALGIAQKLWGPPEGKASNHDDSGTAPGGAEGAT